MIKVCHVTSVHRAFDGRIFQKECRSLSQKYKVYLIAPNVEDQVKDDVNVVGVSLPKSRLKRVLELRKVYKAALNIDATVYHFHDPELVPIARKIKKKGKTVIFDSHEDIPSDILQKKYLPLILRRIISFFYSKYEKKTFKELDAIISVTPSIVNRLKTYNPMTFQVTNYPIYKEVSVSEYRGNYVCFTGAISSTWLIDTLIESVDDIDTKIVLAGPVSNVFKEEISNLKSWKKVDYKGFVDSSTVASIQQNAYAGIALLKYGDLYGGKMGTLGNTKLFEYMMNGTPVIATDFVLWKDIVDKYQCGICVNPYDKNSIAEAISYLRNNPELAKKMGENGQKAVREQYNWKEQEKILFDVYDKILR